MFLKQEAWVMSQPLDDLFLANKPFVMYFEDRKNNISLTGQSVMLPRKTTASSCTWSAFVIGPTNPKPPTQICSIEKAWATAVNSTGIEYTCMCPGVPNPNEKPIITGRIGSINYYSKNYSFYDFLTGNGSKAAPAVGGECIMDQFAEGRLEDCSADWFGESPNKYKTCTTWSINCVSK